MQGAQSLRSRLDFCERGVAHRWASFGSNDLHARDEIDLGLFTSSALHPTEGDRCLGTQGVA